MFDSLPSPASGVPDFGASSASRTDVASKPAASTGHAQGRAAIEIFTSFHALVDALADESDRSKRANGKAASDAAGAVADASAKDAKTDGNNNVVMPVDIAALLMPHTVAPKTGANIATHLGDADGANADAGNTRDLALLLLGAKNTTPDALNAIDNVLNGDAAEGVAGVPLNAVAAAATNNGNDADGAALAQAVIQRLLA